MTTLGSLFNKAQAVVDDAKPAVPPPTPPKTGFKIGGGSGSPAAEPESDSQGQPPPEPAPTPALGGFRIGGAAPVSRPMEAVASTESGQVASTPHPSSPAPAPVQRFADETPASQPQRVLPEDLEESVARFIDNLNHIHTLTPEPDLASNAIRGIMVELRSNPQYIKHVMPEDVRVMIQMMRETMGLAKAVKEKKASTRKKANSAELDAVMAELSDLDDLV